MERIELDRETHTYTPNLPSVSEILQEAGLIDLTWLTEEARNRGSMVHLAAEYYDLGRLDFHSVDPRIEPYLRAFIQFRANRPDTRSQEWIEVPMADPLGLYAGTPDRILISKRELWDLKTGPYKPADKWQTAAYLNMLEGEEPASWKRFCLYLKPAGTYKVREFPQSEFPADLNVFHAALTLYYTKRQEKIIRQSYGNGSACAGDAGSDD